MPPSRVSVLVFDGTRLFNVDTQEEWPAVSGPWGKGTAPKGLYYVSACWAWAEPDPPYTDRQGFCWFASLSPQFQTDRSGFGIHPDGNVPGTRGCIGITRDDTRDCYEHLKQAGEVYLAVV